MSFILYLSFPFFSLSALPLLSFLSQTRSHLSPPFLKHLIFLLSLSLIGWLWFLRSPMVVEDRGGASCCGGGSRRLGSINPPFFPFWALPLFVFQPNTSLKLIFASIKPKYLHFRLIFGGSCWTVDGGQGYGFVQVWFIIYGWWVVAMVWLCWADFLLICVWFIWQLWFDTGFGLANLGLMFDFCLMFDLCLIC